MSQNTRVRRGTVGGREEIERREGEKEAGRNRGREHLNQYA